MESVGRPALFSTPEELEDTINQYFQSLKPKIVNDEATDQEPATITGLALFLGFESRQSFYDYEKKSEFSYTIKRARLRIEYEYEKKLHGFNTTGIIFALKNLGWADKQEIKHEGLPDPVMTVNIAQPSDE